MRFYSTVNLYSDEPVPKLIIERHYSDGTVEYWSTIGFKVQDGRREAEMTVPFKIEIPNAYSIPAGDQMSDKEFEDTFELRLREAAFANLESSARAQESIARQKVQYELEKASKRVRPDIVMASQMPALPPIQ